MIGFKAEHLVTSFGVGIVVGLFTAYLAYRDLEASKHEEPTSVEQQQSLQQTREVLKQFREKNFSPVSVSPEQGKDQCPISN